MSHEDREAGGSFVTQISLPGPPTPTASANDMLLQREPEPGADVPFPYIVVRGQHGLHFVIAPNMSWDLDFRPAHVSAPDFALVLATTILAKSRGSGVRAHRQSVHLELSPLLAKMQAGGTLRSPARPTDEGGAGAFARAPETLSAAERMFKDARKSLKQGDVSLALQGFSSIVEARALPSYAEQLQAISLLRMAQCYSLLDDPYQALALAEEALVAKVSECRDLLVLPDFRAVRALAEWPATHARHAPLFGTPSLLDGTIDVVLCASTLHQGYVRKRKKHSQNLWKRRWAVLTPTSFVLYEEPARDAPAKVRPIQPGKTVLRAPSVGDQRSDRLAFELDFASGETMQFATETEESAATWCRVLAETLHEELSQVRGRLRRSSLVERIKGRTSGRFRRSQSYGSLPRVSEEETRAARSSLPTGAQADEYKEEMRRRYTEQEAAASPDDPSCLRATSWSGPGSEVGSRRLSQSGRAPPVVAADPGDARAPLKAPPPIVRVSRDGIPAEKKEEEEEEEEEEGGGGGGE
jgi:hypothetical protein